MNPFDSCRNFLRWLFLERGWDWVPALLILIYIYVITVMIP